jgi:hypothetical protein
MKFRQEFPEKFLRAFWQADIQDGHRYFLSLCQSPDRCRYVVACDIDSPTSDAHSVFETEEVPLDFLKCVAVLDIAQAVRLRDGRAFMFGIGRCRWFLAEEWQALITGQPIPWATGIEPDHPHRS